MKKLHIDFETFSLADLKAVGAFRYANDPSTEILCAAMALDDGEPVFWQHAYKVDPYDLGPYWNALRDPEVLIYCHNAQFEMAICIALLEETWGIPCPDLSRFRCTMSFARRACLPAKLETLMEALGSPVRKDTRGKALIKKFSMMQPAKKPTKVYPEGLPVRRIRPEDEPEAFAELCSYCAQDVRAEQEVARRLVYFDEPINNASYSLDAVINARGVPVNLVALRHAQKLIEEETEIVSAKFRELVGFEVTQNARLLEWVNKNGCTFEDLQAETVDTFLEQFENKKWWFYIHPESDSFWTQNEAETQVGDACVEEVSEDAYVRFAKEVGTPCEWLVVLALRLKQSIAYAAIKKVKTMLQCAGPHDNRIRGMLNHHGATTGRWTASLVQFQNMKRPTIKYSEDACRDICAGISREMLEVCYGPVLEVISSCIRHFVEDTQ